MMCPICNKKCQEIIPDAAEEPYEFECRDLEHVFFFRISDKSWSIYEADSKLYCNNQGVRPYPFYKKENYDKWLLQFNPPLDYIEGTFQSLLFIKRFKRICAFL